MKSIFLYHNDEKFYHSKKAYRKQLSCSNALKTTIEQSLNIKLSKEELKSLMTNPKGFFESKKNEIKLSFQFPSASEEFNLSSLGIKFEPIEVALLEMTNSDFKYIINYDLNFEESPKEIERLRTEADVYTRNDTQAEAMTLATEVAEKLNRLYALGAINSNFLNNKLLNEAIRLENTFEVNPLKISEL